MGAPATIPTDGIPPTKKKSSLRKRLTDAGWPMSDSNYVSANALQRYRRPADLVFFFCTKNGPDVKWGGGGPNPQGTHPLPYPDWKCTQGTVAALVPSAHRMSSCEHCWQPLTVRAARGSMVGADRLNVPAIDTFRH